jgi:hypothetical protein
MPGNWDQYQTLRGGEVQWPKGPYNTTPTFTATWVDAWVVQDPGVLFPFPNLDLPGPSQSSHGTAFAGGYWTADTHGWRNGNLRPGPALGIALMAMRDPAGHYEFDWWFKIVVLR